jgi:carboxyl-terminal processing protease
VRSRSPIVLATIAAAVAGAVSFGLGVRVGARWTDPDARRIVDAARSIGDGSVAGVDGDQLVRAAIEGMLDSLHDPYAALLEGERQDEVDRILDGSLVGIGVWLTGDPEGLRVSSVLADTPAEDAGLRPGDVIVAVDGLDVSGVDVDRAAELIGGDVGTTVHLSVVRDGGPVALDVVRAQIPLQDVRTRTLDGGVGYVQVLRFAEGTADQVRDALEDLLASGAREAGVVLDLRGNAGGLAEEAYAAAGLFLDGGPVARISQPGHDERVVQAPEDSWLGAFPIAVLVDAGTASAAEILAGALQDRGRGVLVGIRTYGKGSILAVQEVGIGDEQATIVYTSATFSTPDGHPVEGRGITPDQEVLRGATGDPALDRAVELLGAP